MTLAHRWAQEAGRRRAASPPRRTTSSNRLRELSAVAPRHHHRLRDDGDHHAGARHHRRQRLAALHAGDAVDHPGSDQLGADLLHHRLGDHDLAGRVDDGALRPQAALHRLHRRLHRRLDAVRDLAEHRADGPVPADPGRVRRGAGAARPGGDARRLPDRPARRGDGDLGHGHHARADHGPGARRLSDRELFVALGVLRQRAVRPPDGARSVGVHAGEPRSPRRSVRLVRLPFAVARRRRAANDARSRPGHRLVQLQRDLGRGDPVGRPASISSSPTASPASGRSSKCASSATATSRSRWC